MVWFYWKTISKLDCCESKAVPYLYGYALPVSGIDVQLPGCFCNF